MKILPLVLKSTLITLHRLVCKRTTIEEVPSVKSRCEISGIQRNIHVSPPLLSLFIC